MSNIDTSLLIINKIIIHDVPWHKVNDKSTQPTFSENESEVSDVLKLFFKERISYALQKNTAFSICYDNNAKSTTQLFISKIIQSNKDFIELSKSIAKNLFEVQTGSNPAGILMIIKAQIKEFPICIILKLERDKGAQVKLDRKTKTFNINEIKDLMLTEKSRMYKVALFINRSDFNEQFDGKIFDFQNNMNNKKELNTFFMGEFLGCKPLDDPKTKTKKFYEFTYSFIESIKDPVTKTKYLQDLNSYLQMNRPTISPREFADNYLQDTQDKNNYKEFLKQKEFGFENFVKDISLVNRHIKNISIDFANGIKIIGEEGTFKEKVKLEPSEGKKYKAEIVSEIRKIHNNA